MIPFLVVGSKPKTKSPTSTLSIRAITSQRSRTGSPGNSKGASWSEAVANIMTRLGQQKPIPPPLDPVLAQLSFRDWQVLCTGKNLYLTINNNFHLKINKKILNGIKQ